MKRENFAAVDSGNSKRLFIASFVALFFELLVIRYLSTEIRVFAYLKNLPLIACFLGIGVGMIYGRRQRIERLFPWATLLLFALIRFAPKLNLTHVGFPDPNYYILTQFRDVLMLGRLLSAHHNVLAVCVLLFRYLLVTTGILSLITLSFAAIGGLVGEYLKCFDPLRGYAINLGGSLAGILAFTLLALFATPPAVWLIVTFLSLMPFFWRKPVFVAVFLCILSMHLIPEPNTYWSPYYRLDLTPQPPMQNSTRIPGYDLSVNHDFFQTPLDLSPGFMSKYPDFEPNRGNLRYYDFPYSFIPHPTSVLIVGAGTGNDVAAAVRHGVEHIDAVEIDPVIVALGRKFHPEHPYASSQVSVHIDDARAFFSKSTDKYDLIVFGFLDAHTLFSSFSSLRLDNYVYTLESLQAARRLLKPGGTMVMAFWAGREFLAHRLYVTLNAAFGQAPLALKADVNRPEIIFIEGKTPPTIDSKWMVDVSTTLQNSTTTIPTDSWPFLYLDHRTIPMSLLVLLVIVIAATYELLKSSLGAGWTSNVEYRQMFFLGAAFMLLETKAITQLSLLYGSTWIVNSVVITALLAMGFLANLWVLTKPVSLRFTYLLLFISLMFAFVISPSRFTASSTPIKAMAAGLLAGVPVFFSGIIFSTSFKVSAHPERALAVNLFGAIGGGILENAVMLGGINVLGVLAILLYGAAMVCSLARAHQQLARGAPALEVGK